MTDRDLVIKASVQGGEAAKAQVDGLKDSVEKLDEAQAATATGIETGTAAENAYAKAAEAIAPAFRDAQAAVRALGDAVGTGNMKEMVPAFKAAQDAVASFEVVLSKAKAVGAPVADETIAALGRYNAQLAAIAPTLAKHVVETTGATKATTAMRVEMEAGRTMLGPWARAIEAAAQSSNGFVAAIGRFLLPLAAAAGAMMVFNKVATELKDRGVDIETIGDKWGHAMDSFAISVGGTSKAMAGMVTDMEKTQAAFTNLDASEKAYANGLGLLAAAGIGVADQIKTLTGAARDQAVILEQLSSTSLLGYGKSLSDLGRLGDLAVSAANRLNNQLNVIRATAPEVAKGFTEEYFAIQKMTTGSDEQTKALVNLNERTGAAAKSSEDFTAKLALQFPKLKDAGVQYTTLVTNIEQLANGYKLASAANLTEQQTMALLGPIINNVAKGYETFGVQLRQHNPTMVATAEAAHRIMVELDPMAVKMHELALAVGEQTKAFSGFMAGIDAAAKKSGDFKAALFDVHAEMDSEILSLEKQKATTKGLTDVEDARLKSLLALHAIMTPLTVEEEKINKIHEDGLKATHDLSKSYEDLTRARENDKKAIEAHRVAAIAAADAEVSKARSSAAEQIAVLQKQNEDGLISNHDYFEKVNALQMEEVNAKRKAEAEVSKINTDAAKEEKDHAKVYEDAAGAIAVSLGKVGETLVTAKGKQAEYDAFVAVSLAKVRGQWDDTSKKIQEHGGEYPKLDVHMATFAEAVKTGTASASLAFDGLTAHIRDCDKAVMALLGHAAQISVGGATPAPEPTGSAPGSEFTI